MKRNILFAVALAAIVLASCNQSGTIKSRVRLATYNSTSQRYELVDSCVQFKYVDTMAKPGDLVLLEGSYYLIDSMQPR